MLLSLKYVFLEVENIFDPKYSSPITLHLILRLSHCPLLEIPKQKSIEFKMRHLSLNSAFPVSLYDPGCPRSVQVPGCRCATSGRLRVDRLRPAPSGSAAGWAAEPRLRAAVCGSVLHADEKAGCQRAARVNHRSESRQEEERTMVSGMRSKGGGKSVNGHLRCVGVCM